MIRSIRRLAPGCKVEVLTPDFRGEEMPLARVIAERPDVFNHNVETVPRLYPLARRGSRFLRSCRVLRNAKEIGGDEVVTKSGLMTGLGESKEELLEAFGILREHDVQVLTVGQYLRPTRDHLPVVRYWHPDEFAELEREAYALGFESVAAGPLVRSSYHAEQTLARASDGHDRSAAGRVAALLAPARYWRCRATLDAPTLASAAAQLTDRGRRGSVGHSSTSSAASSASAARRAAVERYDVRRRRWKRVPRHADGRQPPDRGRLPRDVTSTAAYAAKLGLDEPTGVAAALRPDARPLAPAASVANRARGAGRRGDRPPDIRGGRRERDRVAAVARDLRLRDAALAPRPQLPAPGAESHDGSGERRALLRAGGRDTAELHRRARATTRAATSGSGCHRSTRPRGGIASARLSDGRIVVFGGEQLEPGGTTIAEVEMFDPSRRRWSALPTCARRATGWVERRWAGGCSRSRAGRRRASRSRGRSSTSTCLAR